MAALWLVDYVGLRSCCLCGYGAQLFSVVVSCIACTLRGELAYPLLYLAQTVAGLAEPLFINNVTLISAAWFPPAERDAAVAASLLFAAAGSIFMGIFAPAAVRVPEQMGLLFAWQVPAWAAILAAGWAWAADEPPAPPSPAAAVMRRNRRRTPAGGLGLVGSAREALWQVGQVCTNANFVALNLSAAIMQGIITVLATTVGQLFLPCGLSALDAGAALAVLAAASCLAVLLYVLILSTENEIHRLKGLLGESFGPKLHSYVAHQWAWSLSTAAGVALVLVLARPGVAPASALWAWGLLGLLSGVIVNGALIFEHAADMTFPLPANVSCTLLGATSGLVAYGMLFYAGPLLELPASADCRTAASPFAAFISACLLGGLALLAFLRPDYRRSRCEASIRERGGKGARTYGTAEHL